MSKDNCCFCMTAGEAKQMLGVGGESCLLAALSGRRPKKRKIIKKVPCVVCDGKGHILTGSRRKRVCWQCKGRKEVPAPKPI